MDCIIKQPHEVMVGAWDSELSLARLSDYSSIVLVTDTQVEEHWLKQIRQVLCARVKAYHQVIMPSGDEHKTREIKAQIEDQLLQAHIDRKALVLGLGGGVVCDMVGFLAASYHRGIDHAFWPTSAMAMLDAALGGKNGVNTPYGKNMIGTVKMPSWVLIDPSFLKTLPQKELHQSMAELVKHALLTDKTTCYQLLQSSDQDPIDCLCDNHCAWLLFSVKTKMSRVSDDPHDLGLRQWLNLGHTLGHAIEQVSAYQVCHGVAVAWGIWFEAALAKQEGLLMYDDFEMICQLLESFNLLQGMPVMSAKDLLQAMKSDKKNNQGAIGLGLLTGTGQTSVYKAYQLDEAKIDAMLSWMLKISSLSNATSVKLATKDSDGKENGHHQVHDQALTMHD